MAYAAVTSLGVQPVAGGSLLDLACLPFSIPSYFDIPLIKDMKEHDERVSHSA